MDEGGPGQSADTEMAEATPPQQQLPPSCGIENIPTTVAGSFSTTSSVTSKYKPPIMPIGKGAYGIICSSLNSETGEHVAIKKIANAFDNKIDAKRTIREIKLLRHMDHENVVAIRDIIPPPQRESFNDVS